MLKLLAIFILHFILSIVSSYLIDKENSNKFKIHFKNSVIGVVIHYIIEKFFLSDNHYLKQSIAIGNPNF